VPTVAERKATPDQLLEQLNAEERRQSTGGRLKVFLGYASGVGKSARMLDEGRRRFERGQDVVIGAIQEKLSAEASQKVSSLEIIPLKQVNGVPVMDMEAILRRRPKVCLVDGLAHDNPPGSVHERRWQDVAQLLEAGISVITSVNLQHIEEKREQVEAITGKHVTDTVPLKFLQTAEEIVVVDASPQACMVSGECTGSSKALTQHQLSELREIALLLAADVVDKQLNKYLDNHGIEQTWGTQERILILLTPRADAKRMLDSGIRNRDRFHGELIVAHLNKPDWSPEQRQRVQTGVELAKENGAEIQVLDGEDLVCTVLDFARHRGITQIYVGHRSHDSWWERAFGNDLDRLIRSAEGIDVRVFPHS
jgi:two-component system sensor histidine kinase KdpD